MGAELPPKARKQTVKEEFKDFLERDQAWDSEESFTTGSEDSNGADEIESESEDDQPGKQKAGTGTKRKRQQSQKDRDSAVATDADNDSLFEELQQASQSKKRSRNGRQASPRPPKKKKTESIKKRLREPKGVNYDLEELWKTVDNQETSPVKEHGSVTSLAKRTGILNLFAEDTPRSSRAAASAATDEPIDLYMDDDDEETKPGSSEFYSIPIEERLILQRYPLIKPESQKKQAETQQRKKQVCKARKGCTVIDVE